MPENKLTRECETRSNHYVSVTGDRTKAGTLDDAWSPTQKEHRQHFKVAVAYAKAAMANPELRAFFQQMAVEKKKRPFDMAVSHYYHQRNDLTSQQ